MFGIDYFPFNQELVNTNEQAEAALGDFKILFLGIVVLVEILFLIRVAAVRWAAGQNPSNPRKRRMSFYLSFGLILVLGLICVLGLNGKFVKDRHLTDFHTLVFWYAPLLMALYGVGNLLVGKFLMPSSKLGSIFGGGRKRSN